jgi:hypothetical protein
MDRGIPTEAVLADMRASDPPVQYLVGTPKGRLSRLKKRLLAVVVGTEISSNFHWVGNPRPSLAGVPLLGNEGAELGRPIAD